MPQKIFGARPGLKKADIGIRRVAGTYGKAAFLTYGGKLKGTIVVESEGERLVSQLLCIDPSVGNYHAQPLTIDILDGAILRTSDEKAAARASHKARGVATCFYTPDFLAVWCRGTEAAIEVKLDLYPGDAEYEQKLNRAREVLWSHAIDFLQVVVPSYWRHPLLTNVPLIHQAALRTDLRPSAEAIGQIERLAEGGATSLGDYCTGLGTDSRMGPVLIAFGALSVDLTVHDLNNSTPVSPAYGSLDHLSILGRLAK